MIPLAAGFLSACAAATPSSPPQNQPAALRNLAPPRSAAPAANASAGSVVALIAGEPATLEQLGAALFEAAGGEVLEEFALDAALRARLREAGIAITDADLDTERQILLARLASDATGSAADAQQAASATLAALRAQRGLGPVRFRSLLWRTAALRALVRRTEPVEITAEALTQAHAIAHGPRSVARVIVAPDLAQTQEALRRLNAGEPFSQVAVELSSDVSAARGGALEPISLADPTYPPAVRDALASLTPGQRSPPVALDSGYAILLLERIEPGDGAPLGQVRQRLERDLILREERLRMDRLAQRLLRQIEVRPLDPALDRAWRERRASPR